MNNNFHLDDMLIFYQVAEQKGICAASRELEISKQTLSRRICTLESNIGISLIDRESSLFTLTAAGQIYFEACKKIFVDVQQINRTIQKQQKWKNSNIKIGIGSALMHGGLLTIITVFSRQHPEINCNLVKLNAHNTDDVDMVIDIGYAFDKKEKHHCGFASFGSFASSQYLSTIKDENCQIIMTNEKIQAPYVADYPAELLRFKVDDFESAQQATLANMGISYLPLGLAQTAIQAKAIQSVPFLPSSNNLPVALGINSLQGSSRAVALLFEYLLSQTHHEYCWDSISNNSSIESISDIRHSNAA